MSHDVYWSAYDMDQTLENLNQLNEKNLVAATLTRKGRAAYTLDIACNNGGRKGKLSGEITKTESERVRVEVQSYRQRNRQLAMVLVPAVLGVGVWIAVAQGSIGALIAVPAILWAGSAAIERAGKPNKMALSMLMEAISEPTPDEPKPRRRRRMKKRQWGKP
jgi:hypothetical protein